jgi:hypothetical protein
VFNFTPERFLQENAVEATKQKEEKREKPKPQPRNRKACHRIRIMC